MNLAVKRAPQSTGANRPKGVFCTPKYNATFPLYSQLKEQPCNTCTLFFMLVMIDENLLNDRVEGPNNQEPVLGTDERAIIFKTPFFDNLGENLNMN